MQRFLLIGFLACSLTSFAQNSQDEEAIKKSIVRFNFAAKNSNHNRLISFISPLPYTRILFFQETKDGMKAIAYEGWAQIEKFIQTNPDSVLKRADRVEYGNWQFTPMSSDYYTVTCSVKYSARLDMWAQKTRQTLLMQRMGDSWKLISLTSVPLSNQS
ncbi:hypothetical protein GK091_25370 [Spirosoma agri]|uniref:Nuclear transport factor 2 family protein n=1 Tax=Spirosoma agri TaxID=1987381 RepID=A0A6M0ISY0_9BACT|nr:hypothetical protein [Spirosoma agri]NEU70233.1 hypothetical protein [Spirosoma agri]